MSSKYVQIYEIYVNQLFFIRIFAVKPVRNKLSTHYMHFLVLMDCHKLTFCMQFLSFMKFGVRSLVAEMKSQKIKFFSLKAGKSLQNLLNSLFF